MIQMVFPSNSSSRPRMGSASMSSSVRKARSPKKTTNRRPRPFSLAGNFGTTPRPRDRSGGPSGRPVGTRCSCPRPAFRRGRSSVQAVAGDGNRLAAQSRRHIYRKCDDTTTSTFQASLATLGLGGVRRVRRAEPEAFPEPWDLGSFRPGHSLLSQDRLERQAGIAHEIRQHVGQQRIGYGQVFAGGGG